MNDTTQPAATELLWSDNKIANALQHRSWYLDKHKRILAIEYAAAFSVAIKMRDDYQTRIAYLTQERDNYRESVNDLVKAGNQLVDEARMLEARHTTDAATIQQQGQRINELEQQVSELEQSCHSLATALTTEEMDMDDEQDEGYVGTVDWVGPSGKTWEIDLYQEDDDE